MKSVNEKKSEIQARALEHSETVPFLVLNWATGTGKSKAALDIAMNNSDVPWAIVCKETNHIQNWIDEIKKHKIKALYNVEIFCYDSLHKYEGQEFNLILDEAHCITTKRIERLKKMKVERAVCLTATMPLDKRDLLTTLGPFRYHTISMNKAIELGLLPKPEVNVMYVSLDEDQKIEYDFLTKDVNRLRGTYMQQRQNYQKIKWLGAGSKRKRTIASFKTKHIKQLLVSTMLDKKFICFTGSIEQCEEIGDNVIHSKVANRDEIISDFNSDEISSLFVVNMLREAMNLSGIELGYIVQLDNQTKSFIQMCGRCFRSNKPVLYIVVVKDTQDEKYLETALEGINEEYVNHYDLYEYL